MPKRAPNLSKRERSKKRGPDGGKVKKIGIEESGSTRENVLLDSVRKSSIAFTHKGRGRKERNHLKEVSLK